MLTDGIGRLRDWALFSAAALTPAIAVGALGLRALASAEAGARREVALELGVVAAGAKHRIEVEIAAAATELETVTVDPDPERAASILGRVAPRFATRVVLAADRSMLVPPPPTSSDSGSTSLTPPLPVTRCRELAATLALPPPRDEARIATARRELLGGCPEVTSSSGRLLWPVVALDPAARGLASPEDIARWIERHALRLSEPEREATRIDADKVLTGEARARAARALSTSWSRRDALLAELQAPTAAAALRSPNARSMISWRADTSVGTLRALEDGRFAGFVVDVASLEDAIGSSGFAWPASMRATVVRTGSRSEEAASDRLFADAAVARDLAIRFSMADPSAVERQASRSRRVLGALGGFAIVAAFALAAVLFARMRAARKSSALRTDFVAAVSHELRTPIASMRILAELLEEGRVEADEQREVFDALAREARRLGETVERLLNFSRMAAGRRAVDLAETRVARVVAAAIDTFEERLPPGAARVVRELDEDIIADVDADQVQLAVDNLLANARKYAVEGTPYRVSVRREAGGVAVTVADSGPGIARRDRARIFEPFERADDRLSRATEGTGIGLSLVRHVATAHGGRAWVVSEPGRGAAFTLWLPVDLKARKTA